MERLACRFGSQVDVIEERDGYVLISLSCRVLRTVLRNFFLETLASVARQLFSGALRFPGLPTAKK
jgi:hypothetical protein